MNSIKTLVHEYLYFFPSGSTTADGSGYASQHVGIDPTQCTLGDSSPFPLNFPSLFLRLPGRNDSTTLTLKAFI